MDLTTNDLYMLIKKKSKLNSINNIKPNLPTITIKSHSHKVPRINNEENIDKFFIMIILNESNISNFIYNSVNPKINTSFKNLEYLSITNNYLINLDFIIYIPDLFYLDVHGNPLEEFEALNYKNTFGYLRLSVEKYHEKNILDVMGLNCTILDVDIKDKNVLKLFKINNPNIIMLNHEIIYYIDTVTESEPKSKTIRITNIDRNNMYIDKSYNSHSKNDSKSNSNINNSKKKHLFEVDMKNNKANKSNKLIKFHFNIHQSHLEKKPENLKLINFNNKIEIKNKFLLNITSFFEELNQVVTKIFKKTKSKMKVQILKDDITYINQEKKKILLLYQTYMKLNVFNEKKKNINDIFVKNSDALNTNKFCDWIKIYEIKQYIKCININIRFGIIILISMLFYCINLVSMKLAITIIHYLLLKYYKFDEHKQFEYFNTFGNIHYLSYYLDNLEDFKSKLKFAEKSQIDLYQKLLDILEVPNLILNINKLKSKKIFFLKNKNIPQKSRVSTILSDIREFKIQNDILILIEFFCDFIQYENIEQRIINGSENDEYSTLIEIKEMLEENELEKYNIYVQDLSVKKFYKNKLESTFNKFFFENNRIKMVKNKNFKNNEKENKKNLDKTKFNIISFYNKWNKEYKKIDEIDTGNCLTVDKYNTKYITNNISKVNYLRNSNLSIEKEFKDQERFLAKTHSNKNKKIKFNNSKEVYNKTENSHNINTMETNYKTLKNETFRKTIKNNNPLLYQNLYGIFSTKNIFTPNKSIERGKTFIEGHFKVNLDERKNSDKRLDNLFKNKLLKNYLLNYTITKNNIKKFLNSEEKEKSTNSSNHLTNKKEKEKEIPRININAYRLYEKSKHTNQNINKKNDKFNGDLLVEKYNQLKQSKIINDIIAKQNKLFQERLKLSKNMTISNK